jgi:H+/Cl- antiporter ClcA
MLRSFFRRFKSTSPERSTQEIAQDSKTFGFHFLYSRIKWIALLLAIGSVIGSACAFFLWSLELVTQLRWAHPWLLYLLPVSGLLVGLIYHHYGTSIEGGNNLLLEEIHQPSVGIPKRMMPLILFGTLMTHLFGGSAGREGTAVQMGGSIASAFAKPFKLRDEKLRLLLLAGIAAGFGGVFGTPLAGAIFAIEVLSIGKVHWRELLPCLIAAYAGDWACNAWHIHHTQYAIHLSWPLLFSNSDLILKILLTSLIFGLVSKLFSESVHAAQFCFKQLIHIPYLRPFAGGLLIIGLVHLLGSSDYLGLGVHAQNSSSPSIVNAFYTHLSSTAWLWKIIFTVITLSCGFKGGEVTPLFFIGATLGNTLAWVLNVPIDLFAALGFIAVFAAASNTPIACTVMGMELFGAEYGALFGLSCFIAFLCSGHSGIYLSQKIHKPKWFSHHHLEDKTLRANLERRRSGRSWFHTLWIRK